MAEGTFGFALFGWQIQNCWKIGIFEVGYFPFRRLYRIRETVDGLEMIVTVEQ
jgi:hypothetical protein